MRGLPGWKVSMALLAAGSLLLAALPVAAATGPTVRPFGGPLAYGSMVLDPQGVPHFAWVSAGTVMTAALDRSTGTLTQLQPVLGSDSPFVSAGYLALVSAGPRLALLWTQDRPSTGTSRIVAAVSEDGGAHFTGPIVVPATNPMDLHAAGDALGDVYVAWYDMAGGSGPYPFSTRFAVLPAGASSFSAPITLATERPGDPVVAADGGRVYVAWISGYQGVDVVRVRTSVDRGASFGPAVAVAPSDNASKFYPGIVAGGGYVYVTWQYILGLRVVYALSGDGGSTFTAPAPWPYPWEGFSYGPDGAFYGIVDVPGEYARVLPGQVNGTRIATGAPGFADTYPYGIVGSALAVDASAHFYYFFTQEHLLEMTGSSFEAEYASYLVTDLPLSGTPFPALEVGAAAVAGIGGALALSRVSRTRKGEGTEGRAAEVLRILGLAPAGEATGGPRGPLMAFALSVAGAASVLLFDIVYFALLQGSMGPYGPAGAGLAVLWWTTGIGSLLAAIVLAAAPRWHRPLGGAVLTGSVLALVLLPPSLSWTAWLAVAGGALAILWLAPSPAARAPEPRCPRCGSPLVPDALFCGMCGAPGVPPPRRHPKSRGKG